MDLILVGYGGWGRRAVRAAARAFDLVGIIEPDEDRAAEARTAWSGWGVEVASSLDELFALGVRVDACWVATPVVTHFEIVKQMLDAGLHVLCEKPFTTDLDQANELIALAEGAGLGLMVGHLSLHSQMLQRGKEWAAMGKINEFKIVRRNDTGPSRADGDVLWGLGPHDVAALLAIAGQPEDVSASGTRHRTCVSLSWENGTTASIELDWLAMRRERFFAVNGFDVAPNWDDGQEPLLAEALAFADLCADPTGAIAPQRLNEAILVTRLLQQIAEARDASRTAIRG